MPRKSSADWLDEGLQHIWLPYSQMKTADEPLAVVGAKGSYIHLADGRKLLDGIASWWTMCHGYQHPHIVKAIQQQAETLSHVMLGGLAHEQAYRLATRLSALSKMDRVFFSDSGSVAVEVALKMALQYWRNRGDLKRTKFICFNHGYHGDTIGAMGVSGKSPFTSAFDSLTLKNYTLDIPTDEYSFAEFEETVAAIKGQVAGLIIEPLVQCAGGFKFHSADILSEIRRVCREHGILFIADEIATGFGRTGSMFACQEAAIVPDIMCVGKALTGGHLPLAATLATQEVFEAFWSGEYEKAFMHGPTYMGNPLACAAANASLDLFEQEPRLEQVEVIEATLWSGLKDLQQHSRVKDVRVKGAIGVVETDLTRSEIMTLRGQYIADGAWLRPLGNCIYFMPPLTIRDSELHQLVNILANHI
ncbi:MAG: adenosylmethionine--8-amino-7-oxononanoate transaminase [Alphaproteobacteria bacterium]|nr:adenosylmethionine--8-amino-7-oxononanoate transaminase [Alphaproteobacteria bacterium]